MSEPIVLLDEPEEGSCDSRGWVETTVDEAAARDLLIPYVLDENDALARPIGPPKRVWLAPEAGDYIDEARWLPTEPNAAGALEFYEFDVQDCEAVEPRRKQPSERRTR